MSGKIGNGYAEGGGYAGVDGADVYIAVVRFGKERLGPGSTQGFFVVMHAEGEQKPLSEQLPSQQPIATKAMNNPRKGRLYLFAGGNQLVPRFDTMNDQRFAKLLRQAGLPHEGFVLEGKWSFRQLVESGFAYSGNIRFV